MAATVAASIGAAIADVFTFALLIPFLNALFEQPGMGTANAGALGRLLEATVGAFLDPDDKMGSLQSIIVVILVAVFVKNVLVWASGQFGAQLQEYVTRDLRNALYRHLQRLPLGWFGRTKTGQILARVLTDTAQTKQLVTEIITRSLQSAAVVITTIAALFAISWRLTFLSLVVAPLLIAGLQSRCRGSAS
jgi:ABC-type multidrug transport system fused ATPase/permease subunit